jgi:hypothetical protein
MYVSFALVVMTPDAAGYEIDWKTVTFKTRTPGPPMTLGNMRELGVL